MEGNMNWLHIIHAPTGDQTHNPSMCPDLELNQQPFTLGDDAQPTDPRQLGQHLINFINHIFQLESNQSLHKNSYFHFLLCPICEI